MKHLKTGIIVAIKERVKDDGKMIKLWNEEINVLRMIENRIPHLTTSTFFGTIDEPFTEIKDKFIIVEWIEGIFIFLYYLFILFLNYFTKLIT